MHPLASPGRASRRSTLRRSRRGGVPRPCPSSREGVGAETSPAARAECFCRRLAEQKPCFLEVRLRDFESSWQSRVPGLPELLDEQLEPLMVEEFAGNVRNLRATQEGYGMRLLLLLKQQETQADGEQQPQLLGFLAYKVWSEPRPSVSICAMAVPARERGHGYGRSLLEVAMEVAVDVSKDGMGLLTLLSLPEAVGFYSRVGFLRTDGQELNVTECEAEDAPCLPMRRSCSRRDSALEFLLEGAVDDIAEESWSSSLCKALEDGPTWPAIQTLTIADLVQAPSCDPIS